MQNTKREKRLLRQFEMSLDLEKISEVASSFLGSSTLCLVDARNASPYAGIKEALGRRTREEAFLRKEYLKTINGCMRNASQSGKTATFTGPDSRHGFCLPLVGESGPVGYIIGCGLRTKPPEGVLALFGYFTEQILKGAKKEMELDELHKTMQPRAIALSTVHTVHRLITSTLYLNELLSRIARLSMQIIGANRCSIKLVDSKKKTLLPKITVDLRTKKTRLKKVKIGRWAPGKAVKYGKSVRSARYLATPLIHEDIVGVITLYNKKNGKPFNDFDVEIMRTLAEQAGIAIRNAQLYKEQEKLTMGSIKALAQIIESRFPKIYRPKISFLRIVQLMGQEFGMRETELKSLQYATILHDAGELMIPEKVLRKKGRLTEKEYKMIREHPLKGAKIIKSLKSLKSVGNIIMYHHESFDGTGYPKGLKGAEIPLGSRIMAIVAAFEAMITRRPYRVTFPMWKAIDEIKKNSGKQFDPEAIRAFLKTMKRKDVLKLVRKEVYGSRRNAKKHKRAGKH